MNVASILSAKGADVITITPDALLSVVLNQLNRHRIGSILVQETDGRIVGIISERDIVKSISKYGASILDRPVRETMTTDVVTCKPGDSIDTVMKIMTAGRFRHLPVIENNILVGIISIGDVVKHKLAESEMEKQALFAYIATG